MTRVNFDTYWKEKRKEFVHLHYLLEPEHLPRRRPRDPEEELILRIMAKRRWEKEFEEGNLIKLAPNRYRIIR